MQTYDKDAMIEAMARAFRISGGAMPFIIGRGASSLTVPGDTTEDILVTIPMDADIMGLLGNIEVETWWSITSSANTKTPKIRFGGPAGQDCMNATFTTSTAAKAVASIANRASKSTQLVTGHIITTSNALVTQNAGAAVDTSLATSIVISGQKQSAGEVMTLNAYRAILYPGN